MAGIEISLFGGLEVVCDDRPVTRFESDKVRALLVYLGVESPRAVPRDEICALLWPDQDDRHARQNLSQALYALRKLISNGELEASIFQATSQSIQVNSNGILHSDWQAFQDCIRQLESHSHRSLDSCAGCMQQIEAALALYRAPFLQDSPLRVSIEFDEWLVIQREAIHLKVSAALQAIIRYYFARGETAEVIGYARQLCRLEPWQESAHRQLMLALALSGRREEALRQFEACRNALSADLGVEPEQETNALFQAIRTGDLAHYLPEPVPDNLPAPLTPFIGRHEEMQLLLGMLNDPACRLVNVFGAGGCGKTRLAMEAGREVRLSYPDGVFFIPLSPLEDPEDIPLAIAGSLNFVFRDGLPIDRQLLDLLENKSCLLILDNFEHLTSGIGWVLDLLRQAPKLTVMTTSRIQLNVSSEFVLPLGGLSFPETQSFRPEPAALQGYDAPDLFLRAARRAFPGYKPDLLEQAALAELCHLLDGMPLALLLAVPWLNSLSIRELPDRIKQDLDFLKAQSEALPPRQRSLKAVCNTSWRLLSAEEQRVFMVLSIFRGGISRDAAWSVAGASEVSLRGLEQKALILESADRRFRIHEVLRQFGAELLAEEPEVHTEAQKNLALHFLGRLLEVARQIKSGQSTVALEWMQAEMPNVQAALSAAVQTECTELVIDALEGLGLYYSLTFGYPEGQRLLRSAAEGLPVHSAQQETRLRLWQADFATALDERQRASEYLNEAEALLAVESGDDQDILWLHGFSAWCRANLISTEDRTQAIDPYQRSIEMFVRAVQPFWSSRAYYRLSLLKHHLGAYAESNNIIEEAVAIQQQIGDRAGQGYSLLVQGFNSIRLGEVIRGAERLQAGAELLQEAGSPFDAAHGQARFGIALVYMGKHTEGVRHLDRAMQLYEDMGAWFEMVYTSFLMAYGEIDSGQYDTIRRRLMNDLAIAKTRGYHREHALILQLLGWLDAAEGPSEETVHRLEESARLLEAVNQRDDLGWTRAIYALVLHLIGRHEDANTQLFRALQIGIELNSMMPILLSTPAAAHSFLHANDPISALEMVGIMLNHPSTGESRRWWRTVCADEVERAAAEFPDEEKAAALARGAGKLPDLPGFGLELVEKIKKSDFK